MIAATCSSRSNPHQFVIFGCLFFGMACHVIAEPFVPGFDRFGRHGEIDQSIAGQLLISELSCTACHRSEIESLQPKLGPNLHDAGSRLNPSWVRRFLLSPHQTKPGTTMPDVLVGRDAQERGKIANELTAFLMSQNTELPPIKGSGAHPVPFEFWKKGNIENGRALYHRVGCVACHEADESFASLKPAKSDSQLDRLLDELDPEELEDLGLASAARPVRSVPQADLASKYSRKSLTHFLINPSKYRPGGRMPDFKLLAMEAADLAAYLQRDANTSTFDETEPNHVLIEAGRNRFSELGCTQCHQVQGDTPGQDAARNARALSELSPDARSGCLDAMPVDYSLDEQKQSAIRLAITHAAGENATSDQESLGLTLLRLNCFACHQREQFGGVGRYRKSYFHTIDDVDLGDEGRLPPMLTHVGKKLNKTWLKNLFAAKKTDIRPHMHVRMPVFPRAQVSRLPELFAKVDRADTSKPENVFGNIEDSAEIGRKLMDVGCVQCHAFDGHTLPGVVGVDLEGINRRIHPRWFHDFLLDPAKLKARTRMPTFFPDGRSQHPNLLDGDVTRQIGAMWNYLSDSSERLPEKIEQARSQNYELIPDDTPIILRTFVQGVGTHAIAVGFPEGVHFVFDTQSASPALEWRGRFIDAQGTWFIRFAPPASPLGDSVVKMPIGQIVESAPDRHDVADTTQFDGYRLDSSRIPTFSYRIGKREISDRIVPLDEGGFRRTIVIESADAEATRPAWLRLHSGRSLERQSEFAYKNEDGLVVSLVAPADDSGAIVKVDDAMAWRVPLRSAESIRVELRYSW